jgi:glycosyltransferase involved in cell wall biosynthesis
MEAVVKKQADSLVESGNEVTILTCRHDRKLPLHERAPSGYLIKRWRAINLVETKLGMAYPIVSPLNFLALLKQLGQYDVVHIHDTFYMSSHVAGLAAILRRKPLFITQHVAIVDHPKGVVKHIQALSHKTIGKLLFAKAQAIVVYNINVKKFLVQLGVGAAKISLVRNGIDVDYFSPGHVSKKADLRRKYNLAIDKPVVIFVGRLIHEKGFDLVFDARSNHYTTLIVGNGTIPKRMRNQENVVFFGAATQSELVDLYKLSDVFVFPAAVEIFALVMQEAMACGLPVITTSNPHYNHYNLKRDLLAFVTPDKVAIRKKIEALLQDDELRKSMGTYCRELALKRFSWRHNYPDEFKIYESIG